MLINSLRGIHVLVPRNMTQAAGFYNTLLRSDEPALLIESLNGYRLKERMPSNVGEFTVPLGVPEVIREGEDVTIVRSEEHTSELQSLMRISYAVFCLKK